MTLFFSAKTKPIPGLTRSSRSTRFVSTFLGRNGGD